MVRTLIRMVFALLAAIGVALTGSVVAHAGMALPTAAPTQLTVTAQSEVPSGAKTRIYVKAPMSLDATAYIERSTDGTTWTRTSSPVRIVDGYGTGKFTPTGTAQYRVKGSNPDVVSAPFSISAVSNSGSAVTSGSSTYQARWGEMVWLEAYARSGNGPAKGVTVAFEASSTGSGSWSRVGSDGSSDVGYASIRLRPTADTWYRARVLNSSGTAISTSEPYKVDLISGDVTLEERRLSLGWKLGAAKGSIKSISAADVKAAQYTGGASSARYQEFAEGMLVEVRGNGTIRTWFIYSRHLDKYKEQGKWDGKLGLPERDVRCGLLEGGCVQLFSGGAIYTNTSKMSPYRYVAYGRTVQVETLAAAYSQKGYEEPAYRKSKYNSWIGGTSAWCEVFVTWATYASGHQGEAPYEDTWNEYLAEVKKNDSLIRDPRGSQIRAGDVLLFDWGSGTPTHTGFAVRVSGSWVYTLEGNTTPNGSGDQRGVYARKRPLSGVWGMYHPNEFKANS